MAPEIVRVRAPARVDFAGGFTDVDLLRRQAPGAVCHAAVNVYVEVSVALKKNVQDTAAPADFISRLAREVAREVGCADLVTVEVLGRSASYGRGLGTSGALSVAISRGVMTLLGRRCAAPSEVIAVAAAAERAAGVLGGIQDQWASADGGFGLLQVENDSTTRRRARDATVFDGIDLVAVFPQGRRNSSDVMRSVLARKDDVAAQGILRSMASVARDTFEAAVRSDIGGLAAGVDTTRQLMQQLSPLIVDERIASSLTSVPWALAAKPCGAGGPGAAWLALADASHGDYRLPPVMGCVMEMQVLAIETSGARAS